MNGYEALFGMLAVFGAFIGLFLIIGIAFYVLMSLGLMKLADNKGIENSWLAWIPIANMYILGLIIKDLNVFGIEIPRIELVLSIGGIAVGIVGAIPVIGQLIAIAFAIVSIAALYKLFKMYRPESATLFTVIGCLLGLAPIFIFIIRNDSPVGA